MNSYFIFPVDLIGCFVSVDRLEEDWWPNISWNTVKSVTERLVMG